MSSRSATVLVIFIVAVLAFCLASVFAAMTGPITIMPDDSDSGGILDNLTAVTDDTGNSGNSYGNPDYDDYSSSDYSSDDSQVETTTDDSSSNQQSQTPEPSTPDEVETTTDSSSDSGVETTTDNSK